MDFLISFVAFIFAISILIGVHEYGHFIVAQKLGIRVLRFSLGFGKALFKWQGKSGTEYVIAIFPLGGYVKMLDESEGELPKKDLPFAFNRQSIAKRLAVVCAGPLFNILFAFAAYWLIFVVGVTTAVPIVGQVAPNSIAAQAGIKTGDELVRIIRMDCPDLGFT